MTHLSKNLPPGESLLFEAKRHWSRYASPSLLMIFGALAAFSLYVWDEEVSQFLKIDVENIHYLIYASLAVIAVGYTWKQSLKRMDKGNQMIITTNYIISSEGVLFCKINSLSIHHVEFINVEQTIFGKIFKYGTVNVMANGQLFASASNIANPITFRNEIMSSRR